MCRRLSLLLALLVLALPSFARERAVSATRPASLPSTVVGTVSAVNGNLISIANGAVVIDATNARVVGGTIEVGSQVHATIDASASATGVLPATTIAVVRLPELTLSGTVQSVDTANKTFVVLGRTIHVTDQTSIAGRNGFADIQANTIVLVAADVQGSRIVAESVVIMAPFLAPLQVIHGTVKSIANDAWVITKRDGDVRIEVNAQTKIVGSPKVGDTVEVVVMTNSANALVAVSILNSSVPTPPTIPELKRINGTVKSIAPTLWVVTVRGGADTSVEINERTRFLGDPRVGDQVEVLAEVSGNKLIAVLITRSLFR